MSKHNINNKMNVKEENAGPLKLVRSSKVIGCKVKSLDGENLGSIDDVVVDISKGDFSYVVVSVGGFLGMGNKLVSIPWDILIFDDEDKSFILKIHHAELENAKGVSADSWELMESNEWAHQFRTHYKTTWGHISPMVSNMRIQDPLSQVIMEEKSRTLP